MKSRKRNKWTPKEQRVIDDIRTVQEALIPVQLPGVYGYYHYSHQDYKVPTKRWLKNIVDTDSRRVYSCKAWLMLINGCIYIISYNTVIGVYIESTGVYYSMGAYSMTTYKHERKALNLMRWEYGIKPIEYINLWVVDEFGREV